MSELGFGGIIMIKGINSQQPISATLRLRGKCIGCFSEPGRRKLRQAPYVSDNDLIGKF